MLKSCLAAVCAATVVFTAAPAAAQSAPTPAGISVGLVVGAQSVEHAGALAGLQATVEPTARIGLFAEGSWLQDVVARRQVETVEAVAAYLAQTQGRPATGSLNAPALAITAGARLFFRKQSPGLRPYAILEGGAVRIALQPALTLAGADVTDALGPYGVTLGRDLTGETTRPAVGGGVGVATNRGRVTIDLNLRVLSIRTPDRATNVLRIAVGLERRF